MKARNIVLSGYAQGQKVYCSSKCSFIAKSLFDNSCVELISKNVKRYELITAESYKNGTSAILRGTAGTLLLGGVGILAGLTAKNNDIYTVAIEWGDGDKSLLEVDQNIYKSIVAKCM